MTSVAEHPSTPPTTTSLRDTVLTALHHLVPDAEPSSPDATHAALVEALSSLTRLWDPYTAGHQLNVGDLAAACASRLGLDAAQVEVVRVAGYFHDVGKMTIPLELLTHPGALTPAEFDIMTTHTMLGDEVLTSAGFASIYGTVAHQHHERLDGSGYPYGLSGDDVLLETRLVTVADIIEATANARLYRPALGVTFALELLFEGRGRLYDPDVVDVAAALFREGYDLVPGPPDAPRAPA